MTSIVYALRNPAMPGLVKIGRTERDAAARMKGLYGSGVPLPFECIVAREVEDGDTLEKALHTAFGPYRINERREFFEVDESRVIALLSVWPGFDATPVVATATEADEDEREAAKEYVRDRERKRRRPNLNFKEMEVPEGAVLRCIRNDEEAVVVGERTVRFRDEERYLTAATQLALGVEGGVAPTAYWTYEGRLLGEIYEDTYGRRED